MGHFIASKTLHHEMGIEFCWPNQTHKQIYKKQVHFGINSLHQVGGNKGIAHQYNGRDKKIH
jgi:hypothetical protein